MAVLDRTPERDALGARRDLRAWRAPLLLIGIVLMLRLPSFFEPPYFGDEGIFAAVAARLLHGATLYTGAWDNKPPLIYLVYAVVMKLFGPSVVALRVVGVALAAGTAMTVFAIARRPAPAQAAFIGAVVFAVLVSVPFFQGTLLLTEALSAMPAALAMLLVLAATADTRAAPGRDRRLLAAGVLFGLAWCAKQAAVLDAGAAGLWLLLRPGRPLRDVAWLAGGWLLPVGAIVLWLALQGAAGEAWRAVLWDYRAYLGERPPQPSWFRPLIVLPAVAGAGYVVWARRRGALDGPALVILWFGFALLAVLSPGRAFGHYLVQAFAPGSVLLAVALDRRARVAATTSAALLAFALYLVVNQFWPFWFSHGTLRPDYYGNWAAYVSGHRDRAAYERFFDWRVPNQEAIARAVRADDGERTLFVWGEYPWAYPLAGATNPTRFATSYHTFLAPDAKDEVMRALERTPPRFIAEELEEWRRLPGLADFLASQYEPIAQIDNTVLWRRRDEQH